MAPSLVVTGQHPNLELADFGLAGFASEHLGCAGEKDPHRHVRAVTAALLPQLADSPALLVVRGYPSRAWGGAGAGYRGGGPIAHVEAGLRTHDPALPWPEEEYRTAIDADAALLFAPTSVSADNLRAEKVRGAIHVTGNTAIDAVLAAEAQLPPPAARHGKEPLILITCHRRESWGEGLASIAAAVAELAEVARIELVLHPNPHVAGEMRRLLAGRAGVSLLEPCGHRELLRRMRDADLVLSDSGGVQEEAPALGVPLLVLRDKTERPEGIEAGCARLVGTAAGRIVGEARRLLGDPAALAAMRRRTFPYGDGLAAPRIAAIIGDWLETSAPGDVAKARLSN